MKSKLRAGQRPSFDRAQRCEASQRRAGGARDQHAEGSPGDFRAKQGRAEHQLWTAPGRSTTTRSEQVTPLRREPSNASNAQFGRRSSGSNGRALGCRSDSVVLAPTDTVRGGQQRPMPALATRQTGDQGCGLGVGRRLIARLFGDTWRLPFPQTYQPLISAITFTVPWLFRIRMVPSGPTGTIAMLATVCPAVKLRFETGCVPVWS